MGQSGHVQDIPWLPATLRWDGQWDWSCSRVGQSGHVQDVPGLPATLGWDGQ